DPASLQAALSHHLAQQGTDDDAAIDGGTEGAAMGQDSALPPQRRGILSQGSVFMTDTSITNQAGAHGEKFEQLTRELPQLVGDGCEVRVEGLSYSVQRAKGTTDEPTVGDNFVSLARALVCLPLINRLRNGKEMETKVILDDVNAVFKPSTTTLVLGPPGCGKSTLLKSLAGHLKQDATHINSGCVTYNGSTKDSGKFSLPKVAHFVEQADRHVPTMTVQETFQFAFDSMCGGTHAGGLREGTDSLSDEQKELISWMDSRYFKVEMVMRVLGLLNAKDTIVGNNSLRGVSGGERRRVTLGEMLCGPQTVFLLDSISTGLDSSTTFDIMKTLKSASRSFRTTVVVALLQPPPETYELFDNVLLMAEGKIIYHGPREDVVPYFNSLGITCPARKDEADWLVELTGDPGKAYRTDIEAGDGEGLVKAPVTAEEFHARWRDSEGGKAVAQELAGAGKLDKAEWPVVYTKKYPQSWQYHLKLCLKKKRTLLSRDKSYVKSQIGSALVMGLMVGSIFFDLGLEDANAKFGLIFLSMLYLSMSGMAQIPPTIEQREVFYKQSQAGFYPTSCSVLADTAVNTALTVCCSILFAPVVYFMAGFSTSDSGTRFLTFMGIVTATNINIAQYFRLVASFMPNFTVAQGFAGLSVLMCVLFCGYLIPGDDIPPWWIWVFYVNPLTWTFRAAVLNEFQSPEYEVCGIEGLAEGEVCPKELGEVYVDAYGFADNTAYIVGGIAFVIAEFWLCIIATIAVYNYIRWDSSDAAPIPASKTDQDNEDNRKSIPHPFTGNEQFNASVAELKRQTSQLEGDLPFEPVTMTFSDVSYSVPHPSGDGNLELLSGISGFCEPGEMTALMGSSGAGKTTLLDVLAGRKTGGTITGDIRLNGHPKDQKTFTRVAGYVEQQDMHSALVTVKEALMFSATMRLEDSVIDKDRREEFVDSILSMLELDVIANRLIGDDQKGGISLEQRKRTTLGVELAANPSIVFLDEPTSGLDARSAQVVMRAIRKVAATQRAVICTIHQPSTYLFEMFDSLLLLKKGGQAVFFGPLGNNSSNLISYLQAIPSTVPILDHVNPATWMLEVIGAGTSSKTDPQVYADYYKKSKLREIATRKLEDLMVAAEGSEPLKFHSIFAASPSLQAKTCMERAVIQYWRNSNYNWMRMQIAIIVAIIFSSSFIDSDIESEADVASRLGVIFMSTMFVGVICLQTAIPAGAEERIVFYREQAANMYSVRSYAAGYAFAELPYILFVTLAFCSIFYWVMGLAASAEQFLFYWLYFLLWVMFMVFSGMMFVMILPDTKVAQTLGGALTSVFSIFAGFLISPGKIPEPWLFAYYLNPLHYIVECTTQFRDDDTVITTAKGIETTSEEFVDDFFGGEYKYENRWYDVMGMVFFILAVRLTYLYALKYVRHLNR
ncbi:unnamed protein product, partial [Scytosiphon promiscuus]